MSNCETWLHTHHYDVWLQWATYHVQLSSRRLRQMSNCEMWLHTHDYDVWLQWASYLEGEE